MRMNRVILALSALACVAACAAPPVSPTAAPNPTPASPATAGALFGKACILQLPGFAGTPAALANAPVTQRAASGIYYHNAQNLSVRLLNSSTGPACQVTYGTNVSRSEAVNTFFAAANAAAPGARANVVQDVVRGEDGLLYFTTTTRAQ